MRWRMDWTFSLLAGNRSLFCFVLFFWYFSFKKLFFPRCVCVFVCARLESIIHDKNRTEENQLSTHISHFQWFLWNSKFRCNVFKFQDKVEHGLVYCCEFYQSFGNSNLGENADAKTSNCHQSVNWWIRTMTWLSNVNLNLINFIYWMNCETLEHFIWWQCVQFKWITKKCDWWLTCFYVIFMIFWMRNQPLI